MPALKELQAQACQVVDISPLEDLVNIQKVVLYLCPVTDLTPLWNNTNFAANDTLYVTGCPLSPHSSDTLVPDLRARGVTVYW
jgi:hypothetical protein